jgi:large subunit ribosomal protein L13
MMATNTLKTFSPKPRDIERRWYVVDADGAVLGRLASEVAKLLRGKHKPIFAPHMDTGDHVIVVNARSVRVTGGKEEKKIYFRHSGYPGGLNRIGYSRMAAQRPVQVVEKAIRGMLPKNRLGRQMARKLSVYEGAEHPHQAQKPVPLSLGEIPKWEGLPKPKPQPEAAPAPKAPRGKEEPKTPARGRVSGSRSGTGARKASTRASSRASASSAKSTKRAPRASAGGAASRRASPKSSAKTSGEPPTGASAGEKRASTRRSRAGKKTEKES